MQMQNKYNIFKMAVFTTLHEEHNMLISLLFWLWKEKTSRTEA